MIHLCLIFYLLGSESLQFASGIAANVLDSELALLSQKLWDADDNRLQVELAVQGKVAKQKDNAPQWLCSYIPNEVNNIPIYQTFISLFDNYNRDDSKTEVLTPDENIEDDDYLKEVMKTRPMHLVHEFLASKGLAARNTGEFQNALNEIWFTPYKRSKALSSSGIEHVMIGETKGNSVSGLHNWIRFCLLEQKGEINYLGYSRIISLDGGYVVSISMKWDKYLKPVTGFFVGTSPAFDLAVYTLCFYTRPNKKCKLLINGHSISIQTYTMRHNGKSVVGSAFPDI